MQHAAQCRPGLAVGTDARCRSPASSRLHCSHCHPRAATLQPQQLHQRADARQPLAVCAGAQQQLSLSGLKASNSSEVAELKSRIADLAGSKNGNDLPTERHAEVKQLLQQLESMNPARKVWYWRSQQRDLHESFLSNVQTAQSAFIHIDSRACARGTLCLSCPVAPSFLDSRCWCNLLLTFPVLHCSLRQ